jgi:aryl-alcohol dehydrogenase-like predicted oxidoreductase
LALAWALSNKDISTLILGFSKVSYIEENLRSLDLYRKWNKEMEDKVEGILLNSPAPTLNPRSFTPNMTRRQIGNIGKK